jgi:cytochrome c oxidase subunit 3
LTEQSANLAVGTDPGAVPRIDQPHPEHGAHGEVAHQFDDAVQQHEAATLGMWAFLATEVLFFGGLFLGYTVYRYRNDHAFATASHQLSELLGAINTAVLLCSSLTMAMAVRASHRNPGAPGLARYLIATCLLGIAFLGIKAIEWTKDYHEALIPNISWRPIDPNTREGRERDEKVSELARELGVSKDFVTNRMELFFVFYFIMTGLHGLHMIVGAAMVAGLVVLVLRGRFGPRHTNTVEMIGLYWHFVDIVWIFLFPMLYLVK